MIATKLGGSQASSEPNLAAAKLAVNKSELHWRTALKEAAIANREIAVIRIKSTPMISVKVEDALNFIRLHKKYYCSVLNTSPQVLGTVKKIESLVAWGEIDAETLKLLKEKREEKGRPFFRLHPPRGGFERKGIKVPFSRGGAYGYRGKEINELIRRMI